MTQFKRDDARRRNQKRKLVSLGKKDTYAYNQKGLNKFKGKTMTKENTYEDIVKLGLEGNAIQFKDAVTGIIAMNVDGKLEDMKRQIATSMFNRDSDED